MTISAKKSMLYFNMDAGIDLTFRQQLLSVFPFTVKNLQDGLQYLGFHLKPNGYNKGDWIWLIKHLEKRINV